MDSSEISVSVHDEQSISVSVEDGPQQVFTQTADGQPLVIYVTTDPDEEKATSPVKPEVTAYQTAPQQDHPTSQPPDMMTLIQNNCGITTEPIHLANPNPNQQTVSCLTTVQTPDGPVYLLTYAVAENESSNGNVTVGNDNNVMVVSCGERDENVVTEHVTVAMEQSQDSNGEMEDLSAEDRYSALKSLVPPAPSRSKRNESPGGSEVVYRCDLCDKTFQTEHQFYGHLHAHTGEKQWECTKCAKKFPTQGALYVHEKDHLHRRPYDCTECSKTFQRPSQRDYHVRRVHRGEKSFLCQMCNKGFFKRSDLRSHLQLHLGIKACICEICGRSFSHVSNLLRHTRTHTGVKPYVCSACGRRFSQIAALHHHTATHAGVAGNTCVDCGKTFKSLPLLKKHVRAIHDGEEKKKQSDNSMSDNEPSSRRFYCHVCGDTFQFSSQLREHNETHKDQSSFFCHNCSKDFPSLNDLKLHSCTPGGLETVATEQWQDMFKVVSEPDPPINTEETYNQQLNEQLEYLIQESIMSELPIYNQQQKTEQCIQQSEKVIEEQQSLDNSVNSTTLSKEDELNDDPLAINSEEAQSDICIPDILPTVITIGVETDDNSLKKIKKKFYRCKECGKVFNKASNYKQHLGTHFAELQKYRCAECGASFAWKSTLNKHLVIHKVEPPEPVNCSFCARSFNSNTLLQDHIRRDHLNHRPHSCPHCPKTFYKKNDLTVHIRTHTKERPYICAQCGKSFSHVSHIIRHERIHTGVKPYQCNECGRRFIQSTALNTHKQKHLKHVKENSEDQPQLLLNGGIFQLGSGIVAQISTTTAV